MMSLEEVERVAAAFWDPPTVVVRTEEMAERVRALNTGARVMVNPYTPEGVAYVIAPGVMR